MEQLMSYMELIFLHMKLGEDDFLNYFRLCYSDLDLYTYSTAWLESNKYMLKFKGTKGDLCIYWI